MGRYQFGFLNREGKEEDVINLPGIHEEGGGEIEKLHQMLSEAGIPHDYHPHMGGWQVSYYGRAGKPEPKPGVFYGSGFGTVCSVIQTPFSYGANEGLLEISGLVGEDVEDSVEGDLDAEEVFTRILCDWDKTKV